MTLVFKFFIVVMVFLILFLASVSSSVDKRSQLEKKNRRIGKNKVIPIELYQEGRLLRVIKITQEEWEKFQSEFRESEEKYINPY